jgi:hypothetical protein
MIGLAVFVTVVGGLAALLYLVPERRRPYRSELPPRNHCPDGTMMRRSCAVVALAWVK